MHHVPHSLQRYREEYSESDVRSHSRLRYKLDAFTRITHVFEQICVRELSGQIHLDLIVFFILSKLECETRFLGNKHIGLREVDVYDIRLSTLRYTKWILEVDLEADTVYVVICKAHFEPKLGVRGRKFRATLNFDLKEG